MLLDFTVPRWVLAVLHALIVALFVAFLYYSGIQPLFDSIVAPFISGSNSVYRSELNFGFQILILVIVVVFDSRFFGLHLGTSLKKKGLFQFLLISTIVLTGEILYLLYSGKSPLSGSGWQYYVLAPISEELLFRAIVFSGAYSILAKSLPKNLVGWFAVLVSAVAFSASHFSNIGQLPFGFLIFQVSYALAFGLVFGYLRMQSGSVVPGIVLHIAVNAVGMVLF